MIKKDNNIIKKKKDYIDYWINNHANGIICYWILFIGMLFQIGTIRQGVPVWMCIPMGVILLISTIITLLRKDIPKVIYTVPILLFCIYLFTQVLISYRLQDGVIFWIYCFRVFVGLVMLMASLKLIESKQDFMLWGIIKKACLLAFILIIFFEIFCFMSASRKNELMLNFYQIANYLIAEWCFYLFNTFLIVPEEYSFNKDVFMHYMKLVFVADIIVLTLLFIAVYALKAPIGFPVICFAFFISSREIVCISYVIERKLKNKPFFISDYYSDRIYYLDEDKKIANRLKKEYLDKQNRIKKVELEIEKSKGETKTYLEDYLEKLLREKEDLQNTFFNSEDIEEMLKNKNQK